MNNVPKVSEIISTYNLAEIQEKCIEAKDAEYKAKYISANYNAAEVLARHNLKPGDVVTGINGHLAEWQIMDCCTDYGSPMAMHIPSKIAEVITGLDLLHMKKVVKTSQMPPDGCSFV